MVIWHLFKVGKQRKSQDLLSATRPRSVWVSNPRPMVYKTNALTSKPSSGKPVRINDFFRYLCLIFGLSRCDVRFQWRFQWRINREFLLEVVGEKLKWFLCNLIGDNWNGDTAFKRRLRLTISKQMKLKIDFNSPSNGSQLDNLRQLSKQ